MTASAASLSDEQLVGELATLIKEYVSRSQAAPPGLARDADWGARLTATETAVFAVDLLRAAEITSFELAAMFNI